MVIKCPCPSLWTRWMGWWLPRANHTHWVLTPTQHSLQPLQKCRWKQANWHSTSATVMGKILVFCSSQSGGLCATNTNIKLTLAGSTDAGSHEDLNRSITDKPQQRGMGVQWCTAASCRSSGEARSIDLLCRWRWCIKPRWSVETMV